MNKSILTKIEIPGIKLIREGKVRSVYDLGPYLLIVASDRISAFDYMLSPGIPNKGRVLTTVSTFWFDLLQKMVDHHFISADIKDFPEELQPYADILDGRSMLVKKTQPILIECVVRGYITGSGYQEYTKTGEVCGHKLPENLKQAAKLSEPIFTPALKKDSKDINISVAEMENLLGKDVAKELISKSMDVYKIGASYAKRHGIILADTKFEFGIHDDGIILIDEVLTPDSSRYWDISTYEEGISPPSFDKQIVRDYLLETDWDRNSQPPELSPVIVEKVAKRYQDLIDTLGINRANKNNNSTLRNLI